MLLCQLSFGQLLLGHLSFNQLSFGRFSVDQSSLRIKRIKIELTPPYFFPLPLLSLVLSSSRFRHFHFLQATIRYYLSTYLSTYISTYLSTYLGTSRFLVKAIVALQLYLTAVSELPVNYSEIM